MAGEVGTHMPANPGLATLLLVPPMYIHWLFQAKVGCQPCLCLFYVNKINSHDFVHIICPLFILTLILLRGWPFIHANLLGTFLAVNRILPPTSSHAST